MDAVHYGPWIVPLHAEHSAEHVDAAMRELTVTNQAVFRRFEALPEIYAGMRPLAVALHQWHRAASQRSRTVLVPFASFKVTIHPGPPHPPPERCLTFAELNVLTGQYRIF